MKKSPIPAKNLILVVLFIFTLCLLFHHHIDGEERAHCAFCTAINGAVFILVSFNVNIILSLKRLKTPVVVFRRICLMVFNIDDRAPPGGYEMI